MKKVIYLLACVALIFTSCKSVTLKTGRYATIEAAPVAARITSDLSISENKVKGVADTRTTGEISLQALKEQAVADALVSANADVLISPVFSVDYERGKPVKVTVHGYPAKHTNFRNLPPDLRSAGSEQQGDGPQGGALQFLKKKKK